MSKFVLLAETGSDIPASVASHHGIYLVPMHVSMGDKTLDDGTFPAEEIVNYYTSTGNLPKTSGCTPEDFAVVFDRIHREHPDKHILHLAYSAVTTCSYQSALIAAEGKDYITSIDTKEASAGQYLVVMKTLELVNSHPDWSIQEMTDAVQQLVDSVRMIFIPDTLEFLHAGGRLSNASFVAGKILNIHPRIEFKDGYLVATKKYRGRMDKLAVKALQEAVEMYNLQKDCLWLLCSPGLSESAKSAAEHAARELEFKRIEWVHTGCVITTHCGPGAFGIVGIAADA